MKFIIITLLLLTNCAVSYYDGDTYKNFAYMKPEISMYVQSFTNSNSIIDTNKYQDLNLRLLQIYSYEAGKKNNEETIKQIDITYSIFTNYYIKRSTVDTNGWSLPITTLRVRVINEAFNILMQTEQSKVRR